MTLIFVGEFAKKLENILAQNTIPVNGMDFSQEIALTVVGEVGTTSALGSVVAHVLI